MSVDSWLSSKPVATLSPMRLLLALTLVLSLACESDPPAPPATIGGGPGGGSTGGGTDGGSDAGERDAGAVDGGAMPGCTSVSPGDLANRALVTRGGATTGFVPRSAFATYNATPCDEARRELVLVLTEDDDCTVGVGRRVVFVIDEDEVGAGLVPIGSPIQVAFSTALSVLYIEPSGPGVDAGLWGNCSDESDGDVTFDRLDVDASPGRASAVFSTTLVDCAATPVEVPVVVTGAIDVSLDVAFEDVCDPT